MEYILGNGNVSIVVRPDLGGRIDQIVDVETGKEWLWHPAWYEGKPRNLDIGASFDENWSGGWDDVFPNDAACRFQGFNLADHGELWSQSWDVKEATSSALSLHYTCRTVPVETEKQVDLLDKGIAVTYRFRNVSDQPLPFLFKLHPALTIEPGDEIIMPRCQIEAVDTGFSTIIGRQGRTPFPKAYDKQGQEVLLNRVRPVESREREFFYSTDLSDGYCSLANSQTGKALHMRFDRRKIPYVWVFQSYGGWRNHYVLMLEPCTNVPYDLDLALKSGSCAIMEGRGQQEIRVEVTVEKTGVNEERQG
jgi:galactose mutarotase-like enzyme